MQIGLTTADYAGHVQLQLCNCSEALPAYAVQPADCERVYIWDMTII